MKKLFLIVTLCVANIVRAAEFSLTPVVNDAGNPINGGTNAAPVLTTNGFYYVDCLNRDSVNLFAAYASAAAVGAGDVNALRLDFFRGMGGGVRGAGIYESNSWTSWVITAATTTTTARGQMTNIVTDFPYLRFSIANVSTNARGANLEILAGSK